MLLTLLPCALAVAMPNGAARNQSKYTNITFAVAGYCASDPVVSAKYVTVNGKLQLQVVIDDGFDSGFAVYCSDPPSGIINARIYFAVDEGTTNTILVSDLAFNRSPLLFDTTLTELILCAG